jgi:hypothetical protein
MSKHNVKKDTGHGYWVYADGYSYWGISVYRNGCDVPIQITEELHNAKADEVEKKEGMTDEQYNKLVEAAQPISKKKAFYKTTIEAIEAARAKKEEEEKAEKAQAAKTKK